MSEPLSSEAIFDERSVVEPDFEIFIPGEPKPAGSKKAFKNKYTGDVIVTDDSGKPGKAWRETVATLAREGWGGRPLLQGAVRVEFDFYLHRAKGHYGTGRNEHLLKDSAPRFICKTPDALKLARAVEDSLKNTVWVDDKQVVDGSQRKHWVHRWEEEGVRIKIWILEPERELQAA